MPEAASLPADAKMPAPAMTASSLLSMLAARGATWRAVTTLYYERVHDWIGTVHPLWLRSKTGHLGPDQDPSDVGTALVLLCMYLVVRRPTLETSLDMPDPFSGSCSMSEPARSRRATSQTPSCVSWMSSTSTDHGRSDASSPSSLRPVIVDDDSTDPIYHAAKRILSRRHGLSPSIELVQAGALVALCELGHGVPSRAYVTFGETVAMSKLVGITPPEDVEEHICSLYWSLFILDKWVSAAFKTAWFQC